MFYIIILITNVILAMSILARQTIAIGSLFGMPGWFWALFQFIVGLQIAHRLWKTRHIS